MKTMLIISFVLYLSAKGLYAQTALVDTLPKYDHHEVKVSYGINNLPNGMHEDVNDIWKGGFTASYLYRPLKWLWLGVNFNWQFPSDTQYYRYREYDTNGSFRDFENTANNTFFAIAYEIRFSYVNRPHSTVYFGLSNGYGKQTGIVKDHYMDKNACWNVTLWGFNTHLGKKKNFFVGGEAGVGYKGTLSIHTGYKF